MWEEDDFAESEPLPAKVEVAHEDVVIPKPTSRAALPGKLRDQPHLTAYFDGGASRDEGVGGVIVWDGRGELLHAASLWFGEEASTNNAAEVRALVALMGYLARSRGNW